MTLTVARAVSTLERAWARAIRHAVFVEEQAVPSDVESDGLDETCDHFLAWLEGEPVATARARATAKGWKLERVAVLKKFRARGVGTLLVRRALEQAPEDATIYVHAQHGALGFWQRVGFVAQGTSFDEGGIAHRAMALERGSSIESIPTLHANEVSLKLPS